MVYKMHGRTLLGAAILVALTACGGGGGDDSPSNGGGSTPVAPGVTVSVSGVASKGLLAYAKVTAYAVKADGTADTANVLGSTITDASGAYTISGLTPSVPVVLKVTPLPAEGGRPATSMRDEVTHAALTVAVDSGFELSAVTVLSASGATSAQITPFTHMAAKLAQTQAAAATGGVTIGDVIRAANNSVSTALNIPILTEVPAFANDGTPTNAAAVKLAAVAVLARNDGTCGAETADLDKIKCAVTKLRDAVPDAPPQNGAALLAAPLVTALNAAQSEAALDAGITNVADVSQGVTTAPVQGAAQATAIASAKALFQSIRTAVYGLGNQGDSQSLASRTNVVSAAFDAVQSPVNLIGLGAVYSVVAAMDEVDAPVLTNTWGNFYFGNNVLPVGNDYHYGNGYRYEYASFGSNSFSGCKVFPNDSFDWAQATDGDMRSATYVGCRMTLRTEQPVWRDGFETDIVAKQYLIRVVRNPVVDGLESYSVKTLLVRQTGTISNSQFAVDGSQPVDLITSLPANVAPWQFVTLSRQSRGPSPYDPAKTAYNNFSVGGTLAPSLWQILWGQNYNVSMGATEVSMSVGSESVDDANKVTKVNLYGGFGLKNQAGGSLYSMVLKPGSFLQTRTGRVAYVNGPVVSVESRAHLQLEASGIAGAVASGILDVDQFVDLGESGANRAIPQRVVFAGSLKESAQASPLYSGTITYTQSHSNGNNAPATSSAYFDARRLVLDGSLVTTGTNTISLSGLTAVTNASGVGSLVGTYTQTGGASVYLDMTLGPVSESSFVKLRSDSAGIAVEVHGTADGHFAKSVPILSNNTLVGLLNFDRARVDYTDSTYEQY